MSISSNNSNNRSNKLHHLNLGGIGIGLMQWGTTNIDNKVVNPKGNLSDDVVREIWKQCRTNDIVFFDTAEGVCVCVCVLYWCHLSCRIYV